MNSITELHLCVVSRIRKFHKEVKLEREIENYCLMVRELILDDAYFQEAAFTPQKF